MSWLEFLIDNLFLSLGLVLKDNVLVFTSFFALCECAAEELQQKQWDQGNGQFLDISLDLSRGNEAYPICVVNESNSKSLPPSFFYISKSEVHQDAHVNSSLTRIGDDHCCPSCKDNCLTADFPCACARETGGEFAYTHDGCLADRYLAKVYKVVKII